MKLTVDSSLEEMLNAYIADEYFASMQYRMAKVVAKGKALEYSNNVFGDNGDDEDEHFDEIVEYAQSLKIPVQVNPEEMKNNCTTPFVEIHDGDTTAQLVSILISAEKKAIEGYEIALKNENAIKEHPELTQFFGEILNDERGHLKELEDLESNISADGKTVPQADDTTDGGEKDSETQDGDVDNSEDDGNEEINEKNESVEASDAIKPSDEIKRKILLKQKDSFEVAKNLLSFITEEKASDFADYGEYFNSDLARDTSQYDENQCKNKFIEMINDGMIEDGQSLLFNLIDFVGDDEVAEFCNDFGYTDNVEESEQNTAKRNTYDIFESGMSFSSLFKQSKVK